MTEEKQLVYLFKVQTKKVVLLISANLDLIIKLQTSRKMADPATKDEIAEWHCVAVTKNYRPHTILKIEILKDYN